MANKKVIPRLRVKARITSKVREKDLREKARLLADDPELILPDCEEDCGSCRFKKTRARLEKIAKFKDDPAKLAKFSRGGDKLGRAYAATIGLAHEEKTPYLASATYSVGTITYALRGKTPREKLIAVQNFDSPKWRILGVLDLVQKRGLHFYSYGDHFVCTGKYARPPAEYVKMAASSAGADRSEGDSFVCPHNPSLIDHLTFDWVTSGKKVVLCDQCAVKNKNTLKRLAEGMAVPKALNEFEISVVRPLKNMSGKEGCGGLLNTKVEPGLLEEYYQGKIGDRELIDRHLKTVREHLKTSTKKAYVRGDKCFGDDLEAFAADVTPDEIERKALVGILKNVDHPVVVDSQDSVNDILTAYWPSNGKDAMSAVVSKDLADKFFSEDIHGGKTPLKMIHEAIGAARHAEVTAGIPRYSCLSEYGGFADKVARAFKTRGGSGAMAVLDSEKSNDHRLRSISYAFYLALGDTTKSWRFTDEEKEYGKHLRKYARALLDSAGADEHHSAFETFLREAGCSEEIKKI